MWYAVLENAAAILNNLTIKATMTGWSLDRLISGEFKNASDHKLLNTLRSAIILWLMAMAQPPASIQRHAQDRKQKFIWSGLKC